MYTLGALHASLVMQYVADKLVRERTRYRRALISAPPHNKCYPPVTCIGRHERLAMSADGR
jgi:hypothetical protein